MSDDATLLRDAVARFLGDAVTPALLVAAEAGFPADFWRDAAALGLDRVAAPVAAGGGGAGFGELALVLRDAGAALAPGPLAEAMAARALLAATGLPQPDGIVTLAPDPLAADAEPLLADVPWGHAADWVVAERPVARGTAQLWLVPARELAWTRGHNLAGEARDTARLPATLAPAWAVVPAGAVRAIGAFLRSCQVAGAGARVLASARDHAAGREQFGRPLAAFQVIQHDLARLAEAVAAVEAAAFAAGRALAVAGLPGARGGGRGDAWLAVAAARITAGDRVDELVGPGHQLHGAMGFTAEHGLHFATRRLLAWRAEFGPAAAWAAALGTRALARGGDRLWQDLTAVTDA